MDYTTQRGILQLIIGACCLCFALSMAMRARGQGGPRWPLQWVVLVTLWIASVAWSFGAHGWRWLRHGADARFDDWVTTVPLYFVCLMSLLTFYHWLRYERKESV